MVDNPYPSAEYFTNRLEEQPDIAIDMVHHFTDMQMSWADVALHRNAYAFYFKEMIPCVQEHGDDVFNFDLDELLDDHVPPDEKQYYGRLKLAFNGVTDCLKESRKKWIPVFTDIDFYIFTPYEFATADAISIKLTTGLNLVKLEGFSLLDYTYSSEY